MFKFKRKKYVILVLEPKIGYFADVVGNYTSTQQLALKLSKQDAEELHTDLSYLGVISTVLEYEGGDDNDGRSDT